ncbi:MAG TPA: carboxypeptidase regulatory-like domain-containing protein [Acidobacteriaceae bacterium]|jgi:outer membrane receptor protein involved in Fe transport|nr:carboxypeptidase regulatory-like domain-containing protein [Acidobacteriaceae bacterium]
MRKSICKILLLAGMFILLTSVLTVGAVPAAAQSTTEGAIAGTVFDTSGAVIPGAAVVLRNTETNGSIRLSTDSSGYFKAPLVPSGNYTVTITASGFGPYTANQVAVTVGSLTELQPVLKTGSASEIVTVTGESPVLKMESPEISETITSKEILNLPLNGGRWSDLALLTPGAVSDGNGFGLIVFRGISPLLNNVEIDGADDNQAFFSEERGRTREGYSTSQIGIAEFQVNTGVYSAEFGRAAGGVINSITKSGTNTIHGQAYFFDRDNAWGAINPFTTLTSVREPSTGGPPTIVTGVPFRPKDWRKRWGFGAGGPLMRDKLFWFYAYDQYRRDFPGVAKPGSPAAFFNQWADLGTPGSSAGDVGAQALANRVYGGNYALGAAHYDQLLYGTVVSSLTGLTGPGLLDDLGTTPRTGDEVLNTPKLDWQINDREHLSFLYHRLRWDSPGGVQTQTSNNYAIDTFGTDFVKLDYGMAKLDSLFSSTLTNELRFQYGRELDDEGEQPFSNFTKTYLNNSTGTPVQLMIYGGSSSSNGFTAGMPYYSFRAAYPAEWKDQVGDTATWLHNNHSLKFGFDILRNNDEVNNLYESNGVYTYTYFSDFFADVLQPSGTCDSTQSQTGLGTYPCYFGFTQGFGTPRFQLSTIDYGFFAQDDWKVRPRLTLNLGVRYDYEHVPPPYPALLATSVLNTGVTVNGTTVGPYPDATAQVGNQPSDLGEVGPRIGFSWDPYGRGRTVIHGGYGIYFGRNFNGDILNAYEAAGSPHGQYTIPTIFGQQASSTVPVFPQVIPGGSFPTPGVDFFAKNFKNPEVHEFDLTLQQQVGKGTFFSVDYMGALARELPNFLNLNLNPATMKSTTLTLVAGKDGTCGKLACGTQIPTTYYAKPYVNTHYGNVTEVTSNINSSYNGLVVDLENRGNPYAQFDVNYTWSHALDFNQNQSTAPSTNSWWDPWHNPRANYGNSTYNVPNRFVAWGLLTWPGTAMGWQKYVENGWHLNPVLQVQNGLPYSAGVSGTISGAAGSGLVGTGNSGYLLQIGRNTYRMPNTADLDARLQKDILLSEKRNLNLELLGEAFNLFNHMNVTGINSTAYSIGSTGNLTYQSFSAGPGKSSQSGFGAISNADSTFVYSQREIQLGLKLDF